MVFYNTYIFGKNIWLKWCKHSSFLICKMCHCNFKNVFYAKQSEWNPVTCQRIGFLFNTKTCTTDKRQERYHAVSVHATSVSLHFKSKRGTIAKKTYTVTYSIVIYIWKVLSKEWRNWEWHGRNNTWYVRACVCVWSCVHAAEECFYVKEGVPTLLP